MLKHQSFTSEPLFRSFIQAPGWTGQILQVDHNRRARTFAGEYALTANREVLVSVLEVMFFVPLVVGRLSASEGLGAWVIIQLIGFGRFPQLGLFLGWDRKLPKGGVHKGYRYRVSGRGTR